MARIKVQLNRQGVLDVLNSAGVRQDIERRTNAIRNAANATLEEGEGYHGDVITTDRPHGAVVTYTKHAKASNAKHNTLLKALDAGRD